MRRLELAISLGSCEFSGKRARKIIAPIWHSGLCKISEERQRRSNDAHQRFGPETADAGQRRSTLEFAMVIRKARYGVTVYSSSYFGRTVMKNPERGSS